MSDLAAIRQLIRDRMLENGGGVISETYTETAKSIGISQPSLYVFLTDEGRGMDVATCIRVARYLSQPAATILRLAGHDDIADMLSVPDTAEDDAYIVQLRKLLADLSTDERSNMVSTLRTIKKSMRLHYIKNTQPT